MRALSEIIRWYISIEDGECPVERDLGVLSEVDREHKNGKNELAEDVLLAKDDSTTPEEVVVGAKMVAVGAKCKAVAVGTEGATGLGKKGKRWAALWLQVHGRRLGIGKGGKRTVKRTGTYMAVKKGVLAAAEYAMAEGGDGMAPHP